jgi:hypothetical protein
LLEVAVLFDGATVRKYRNDQAGVGRVSLRPALAMMRAISTAKLLLSLRAATTS